MNNALILRSRSNNQMTNKDGRKQVSFMHFFIWVIIEQLERPATGLSWERCEKRTFVECLLNSWWADNWPGLSNNVFSVHGGHGAGVFDHDSLWCFGWLIYRVNHSVIELITVTWAILNLMIFDLKIHIYSMMNQYGFQFTFTAFSTSTDYRLENTILIVYYPLSNIISERSAMYFYCE